MSEIIFEECSDFGYRTRTEQNIIQTDGTLMVYVDGYTGGECLTRNLCIKHKKPRFEIDWTKDSDELNIQLHKAILWMNKNNIQKLNIAGNGLYTWYKYKTFYTQERVNDVMNTIMNFLDQEDQGKYSLDAIIKLIQSGGQSGIDEAAIIWAINNKYPIPAKVIAPKGWVFRDITGKDIVSENLFKERFKCKF